MNQAQAEREIIPRITAARYSPNPSSRPVQAAMDRNVTLHMRFMTSRVWLFVSLTDAGFESNLDQANCFPESGDEWVVQAQLKLGFDRRKPGLGDLRHPGAAVAREA